MGASGSLLTATITFEPFIPARCWIAPEIPAATYSSGATTFPVWPTCQSFGTQPASTAARLAPTAAPSSSASASTGLKSPFVPRPAATTTRASVSSGRSLFTSLKPAKRVLRAPASTETGAAETVPFPSFAAAGNSVGRIVNTFTGVAISTSARTLPAHIGRRKVTAAPSPPKPSTSVAIPAPSFAAARGRRSLPNAVAAAPTKVAWTAFASSATTGAYASASGCSRTAASAACTSAPQAASSWATFAIPLPSTARWSFPPVRRASSRPAEIAWRLAFLSDPFTCSATMRTFMARSKALEDLRLLVKLLPELLDVRDLQAALACGRRLELLHDHLGREVDPERRRRELGDRLLLRLHDAGERGEARLVEPQVRRHDGGEPDLQRLDAAVHLADHRERLAVLGQDEPRLLLLLGLALQALGLRRERRLREPEPLREVLAGLVLVVVDRLLAEDDEVRLLLLEHLGEERGDDDG